jgi:hypothetical protein
LVLTSPRRGSNGPDSIKRLVTSSPLTDPVNTLRVCSVFLLLSDGDLRNAGVVRDDTPWWEGRDGGSFCMAP